MPHLMILLKMPNYFLLFLTLLFANTANAFLDYCQDIALPDGYAISDERFPLCQFEAGLTVVSTGTPAKYGFANEQGKLIIPAIFDEAYNFQNDLALIKQNGKYGYINPQGNTVIAPAFADAWGFNDDLAKVSIDNKIGFINKQGELVIKPQFDDSKDWFESGVLAVFDKTARKWGMINKTGKLITPYAYDFMDEPKSGRVLVGKNMFGGEDGVRFGYLDLVGNVAIAPMFKSAKPFKNGIAEVITDSNEKKLINTQGKIINQKMNFDY